MEVGGSVWKWSAKRIWQNGERTDRGIAGGRSLGGGEEDAITRRSGFRPVESVQLVSVPLFQQELYDFDRRWTPGVVPLPRGRRASSPNPSPTANSLRRFCPLPQISTARICLPVKPWRTCGVIDPREMLLRYDLGTSRLESSGARAEPEEQGRRSVVPGEFP